MQRTESIRACQLNPDKGSNTQKWRALDDPFLTTELVSSLLHVSHVPFIYLLSSLNFQLTHTTIRYWNGWVSQSTYTGSWKEAVLCSALALKLLIFEPTGTFFLNSTLPFSIMLFVTGAIVASPTFSLPEYIGGVRNWCSFL